jgi:hypothetical protein
MMNFAIGALLQGRPFAFQVRRSAHGAPPDLSKPGKSLYSSAVCSVPVHGFAGHHWKTHLLELYDKVGFPLEASTSFSLISLAIYRLADVSAANSTNDAC